MEHIYLTRRNLQTLLNKLDKVKAGGVSFCTLEKNDTTHSKYPCSMRVLITAVEDEDYYVDRHPGYVRDAPKD